MRTISESRCFGGVQGYYAHPSAACASEMRFSLFLPPVAAAAPVPLLMYLSGLTCTEENATIKAGFQRVAAELGLAIAVPDTSPRGADVPDVPDAHDLGQGAGFYVDATQMPWATHFRMGTYVSTELPMFLAQHFPVDTDRLGVFGHSMGGHGALITHLRAPDRFRSVSAFAPIAAPTTTPWGMKAFGHYLGDDRGAWADHDACQLINRAPSAAHILVDQGADDPFRAERLRPELLEAACMATGQKLTMRIHPGYDHSYFFVATFIEDHLRWHAATLLG